MKQILQKIKQFSETLNHEEFYAFYELMTSLSGPATGDYIRVGDELLSLKKIVRRLRITVMWPRFKVDYADPYTKEEALNDYRKLLSVYDGIGYPEKNTVARIMKALLLVYRQEN